MTEATETVTVEAPVELPELRYEYQPLDEQGRKLGGVQVVKYRTQDELIEGLKNNNILLQRRVRELNRKVKTGQFDVEEIPAEAPRDFQPVVDLQPESLTADQLIEMARDLTDPTKLQDVYRRLAKAEFGAEPAQIRGALTNIAKEQENLKIGQEVDKFLAFTPEYYICKENWDTIYNWMTRFNLDPVYANFKLAYERLTGAGILLTDGGTMASTLPTATPTVLNEGPDAVVVNKDVIVPVTPPPPPVQRISTALTNESTSNSTPPMPVVGSDFTYTRPERRDSKGNLVEPSKVFVGLQALDAMPSDMYRDRYNRDPNFRVIAEKILATRVINKNQRGV